MPSPKVAVITELFAAVKPAVMGGGYAVRTVSRTLETDDPDKYEGTGDRILIQDSTGTDVDERPHKEAYQNSVTRTLRIFSESKMDVLEAAHLCREALIGQGKKLDLTAYGYDVQEQTCEMDEDMEEPDATGGSVSAVQRYRFDLAPL